MNYPDVGFCPEYQELFKGTAFGGEPKHVTLKSIDYRFYKRPIEGTPYFDIVFPYGYAGPIPVDDDPLWAANYSDYSHTFHQYCKAENIVAEFARLHPFIMQCVGEEDKHYEHEVFYVDLTQTSEQIWAGLDKGCRGAVKKKTDIFYAPMVPILIQRLYEDRMTQKGATEYEFDGAFFGKLNASGFAHCFSNNHAGVILLRYGDYCHYFLSASDSPNQTSPLLWEAIQWAKRMRCKVFNMGGGLKAGDSLESFKRSFTKTSKPFFTYRKVHNQEVYNELCKSKGVDPTTGGFFPAYRRLV